MAISACMIVKNEEELLPGCLDSIKGIFDEIIIVDTGSIDNTVKIAESYGAKVYHHKWEDDFSKARNQSLQYAQSDWILQIDADERIFAGDGKLIREEIKDDTINAIAVYIYNDSPTGQGVHQVERIFRTGKVSFSGIVHNQPKWEGNSKLSQIRIRHLGYNLAPEKMKEKYQRSERLLRKQLEANQESPFVWRNLIRNWRAQEKYIEIVEVSDHVLSLKLGYSEEMIRFDIAYALAESDQQDEAIEMLSEIPRWNIDANYLLGFLLKRKKEYKKAVQFYERYLNLVADFNSYTRRHNLIIDTLGNVDFAYNEIGTCYFIQEDFERALTNYRQAVKLSGKLLYSDNMWRTLDRLFEGKPLKILFVQYSPCMRNRKMAIALRKENHIVDLAFSGDNRYKNMGVYDNEYKFNSYSELIALADSHDIVHVHNEPDVFGVLLSQYSKSIVIHDTHDAIELRNIDNPFLFPLSATANKQAAGRIYTTIQQMEYAKQAYNIDLAKSLVIYNYCSEDDLPSKQLPKLSEVDGEIHIVYEGGVGGMHRNLKETFWKIAEKRIHIHIYPSFHNEEYQAMAETNEFIHYSMPIPPDKLIEEMTQFDFGIIPWNIEESSRVFLDTCIANKLFEYNAAGLPVIVCNTKALAKFTKNNNMGIVYEDIEEIWNKLDKLKKPKQGKPYLMEGQICRLIGFYRMLISDRQAESQEIVNAIQAININEFKGQAYAPNERSIEYGFVFDCLAQIMPKTILDVGPGTTALPSLMSKAGFLVFAVDNWKDYWKEYKLNRHWHIINDDIQNPEYVNQQKYDFITCISVLEHIEDFDAAMANMMNMLNPGGYIVLTIPYNENRFIWNIYEEPECSKAGAGEIYYKCHVFSRKELDNWVAGKGNIIKQSYWNIFSEGLWTSGKRFAKPRKTSKFRKHDISCILIQKKEIQNVATSN